jgi:hypothetical protein
MSMRGQNGRSNLQFEAWGSRRPGVYPARPGRVRKLVEGGLAMTDCETWGLDLDPQRELLYS